MTNRRGMPRCPSHLNDAAKAEWKRVAPRLWDAGLLNELYVMALAAYCDSFALWEQATKEVLEKGEIIENNKGQKYRNPSCLTANNAYKQACDMGKEFGLVPFLPATKKKRRKK